MSEKERQTALRVDVCRRSGDKLSIDISVRSESGDMVFLGNYDGTNLMQELNAACSRITNRRDEVFITLEFVEEAYVEPEIA